MLFLLHTEENVVTLFICLEVAIEIGRGLRLLLKTCISGVQDLNLFYKVICRVSLSFPMLQGDLILNKYLNKANNCKCQHNVVNCIVNNSQI